MNRMLLPSQKCKRIIQERNFKFSTFIHNSSISYVMLPSISNRFAKESIAMKFSALTDISRCLSLAHSSRMKETIEGLAMN